MKRFPMLILAVVVPLALSAQPVTVYPPHWWTGMKMNNVQLLVRNPGASKNHGNVTIKYPGVVVTAMHEFENPNYIALDISISPDTKPGLVAIEWNQDGKAIRVQWNLESKRTGNGTQFAQGVTSKDLIDLLITDRFSNGDPSNDRVPGMREQSLNRDSMYLRHGGDFQGIINHLDYFKSMGVTALWLLPVMENDRPERTEHGYAITDHYKVDPRLGGDAGYKKLSATLHQNGMKLVMDAVYNHIGLEHFLESDPPASDWMHRWPVFTRTNHREQTWFDPYAAPSEKKRMTDGWFDRVMPDINQDNPFMANFLIQNMIWHIQEFGIDAIRIDTYTYNDQSFANRCNQAIMDEYPKITLFGETRGPSQVAQPYFNQNVFNTSFKSNMQGSVDFQCLYNGIIPALTQPFGWMEGVSRLYVTLGNDFLNIDPMRNVLLLDNHDEARFFSIVKEDVEKQKIGYEWLLTCRGIPQIYYGSEVLLKGFAHPDGLVRSDFPGGWAGDKKNAFTGEGLSPDESDVLQLIKKLGIFRLSSSALKAGKMMHYIPVDGLYVYFRYDEKQTIMCVMNTGSKAQSVNFTRYTERTAGFSKARNVITEESFSTTSIPVIPPMGMWVLEMQR